MASTTRGSIKISTANGIGAALVDVLGGEGYKPDEWEQNINLCGIHAADIESALENIEEDAGTGTERGSILLTTANAIGATLNKKFNTSRGFSPREWASAASKLEPLPERTASGAIANITDGADGVPIKNWLVTLPASLDGYSEVNGTKIESNNLLGFGSVDFTLKGVRFYTVDGVLYLDGSTVGEISSTDNAFNTNLRFYLPAGTYYLNRGSIALPTYIYDVDNMTSGNAIRTNNGSFTLAEGKTLALGFYLYQKTFSTAKLDACVNIGSTAITYEDTAAPTQYTAQLGRTIYGGTADIVTGEGEDENGNAFTFTPITPTPETALGSNNFWSDQGESAVTYRKDLDIPDPVPGNLLGMNNGNNNEEESEG